VANIYELTAQAQQLQQLLEAEEIDEATYNDTLEALDIEDKVQSICCVIKNFEAQAAAIKVEKDRLAKKQKTAENRVERLRDSLIHHLQATNQAKVKTTLFNVALSSSKSLKVVDETMIPQEYLIPQPDKVDIAGMKKAIKEGAEIYGVEFEESPSLRIS
jgi:hypothetical protein